MPIMCSCLVGCGHNFAFTAYCNLLNSRNVFSLSKFHYKQIIKMLSSHLKTLPQVNRFFSFFFFLNFILLCFILSYLILSYLILSYLILSYLILSYLILSYLILSYLILSYLILSYLILNLWI